MSLEPLAQRPRGQIPRDRVDGIRASEQPESSSRPGADPGWQGQSPRETCQFRSVAAHEEGDGPLRMRPALSSRPVQKGGSPPRVSNPDARASTTSSAQAGHAMAVADLSTTCQPGQHPHLSVHSRGAEREVIRLLGDANLPAVLHWYTGPIGAVDDALAVGLYFSFNAAMTRPKRFASLALNDPDRAGVT